MCDIQTVCEDNIAHNKHLVSQLNLRDKNLLYRYFAMIRLEMRQLHFPNPESYNTFVDSRFGDDTKLTTLMSKSDELRDYFDLT